MRWKKASFLIVLVAISILLCFFSGCAKQAAEKDEALTRLSAVAPGAQGNYGIADSTDGAYSEADFTGDDSPEFMSVSGSVAALSALENRKVIFNANMTIEVEYFDESYGKIRSIIAGNGFVQSSSMSREKYYDRDGKEKFRTRGVIVIRVAQDKFDSILDNIRKLGDVLEEESYTDDVTDKYFDVESRLKILRLQEDRLISYLQEIKDPETIFKYEKSLTEIRQEIEKYTGTLRKWDDLVDLSTITINLRETRKEDEPVIGGRSYWQRLGDKFVSSVKGTVRFVGEAAIFLAQALPVLVLLGVFTLALIIIIRFLNKILRKNRGSELPG